MLSFETKGLPPCVLSWCGINTYIASSQKLALSNWVQHQVLTIGGSSLNLLFALSWTVMHRFYYKLN